MDMGKFLFETEVYSVKANAYARSVMLMMLMRFIWMPILLICSCIILAMTINFAFVYVALMLLFILLPMVLMLAYFSIITTEEARIAVLSKSLKFDESGIMVEFAPITDKLNKEDNEKVIYPQPLYINNEEVKRAENLGKSVRIFLKGGRYRFISIPFEMVKGNKDEFLAHVLCYNDK